MKKRYIILILIGIVVIIPAYFIVSNHLHSQQILEQERARRDSIIQIEVAKFARILYRNQCKADSVIAEVNKQRIANGLPAYNVKIQGEITESGDPMFEFYGPRVMYGACLLDSTSEYLCDGFLFYLDVPEHLHRLSFYKTNDRFYKAYSRKEFAIYKMWRRTEILPSEFEGVRSR